MKNKNLINEIKRISTLMMISNKNNFIYESLNENKIILDNKKSLLTESYPPVGPYIDRLVKIYEKLAQKGEHFNLKTKIRNTNLVPVSDILTTGQVLINILEKAKTMPQLTNEVLEIVIPLWKIQAEQDKSFAKTLADSVYPGFEIYVSRIGMPQSKTYEEIIEKYTDSFGKNVIKNLEAKSIEKSRNDLFNYSKITSLISPLTAKQITSIEEYTTDTWKKLFQSSETILITDLENIYKLVKNYKNLTMSTGNSEITKENKRVLNLKLDDFAKTYNQEFISLIELFQNPNAPQHVKDAYQDIIKIPSVAKKMQIMSTFSNNKGFWKKFTTLRSNIYIGLKNAFWSKTNKGVTRDNIKDDFDNLTKPMIIGQDVAGRFQTFLNIFESGVAKGKRKVRIEGKKFDNPQWEQALIRYGRDGVTTQQISELGGRMIKYQLLYSILNIFIGIASGFQYEERLNQCKKGCNDPKNQDKNGKIIIIPKACQSKNSFTEFLFLRYLKHKRFTDTNLVLRSINNIGNDMMGSSKWGHATRLFPGFLDDVLAFLWDTNVSDISFNKWGKDIDKKENAALQVKILNLLNTLNAETKKINSEEKPNGSNNDSDSTNVPQTNTLTSVPTNTLTSVPTNTFTPQPPPQVEYEPNEQSFREFLKNQSPPETYKEGSYNKDSWVGKNSDNKKYYYNKEKKIFD